jgi:uncharacterized protein YcnI
MSPYALALGLLLGTTFLDGSALAHVTLDQPSLPADSSVRVAIRVPHGCEGTATTGIRLQVPPELRGLRAMPVAGWTLTSRMEGGVTVQGEHGTAHVPREVSWQGGNLPDDQFQEFVMLLRTPAQPGATLYFPVVQECEGGKVSRWIERPSQPGETLRAPAYAVRIVPKN